jgi:hypothetical protein
LRSRSRFRSRRKSLLPITSREASPAGDDATITLADNALIHTIRYSSSMDILPSKGPHRRSFSEPFSEGKTAQVVGHESSIWATKTNYLATK